MPNVTQMEIITLAIVYLITLAILHTVALSVFPILNVLTTWLVLINTVRILVHMMFVAKMPSVMSLAIHRFANASKVMLAMLSFNARLKKPPLNMNRLIRVYQAHVARMPIAECITMLVHANV